MQAVRELTFIPDPVIDPDEEEYAKDIWDVRKLTGVRRIPISSDYYMNFSNLPPVFRPLVKAHIRRELVHRSQSACILKLRAISRFMEYYHARCPQAQDLTALIRQDIEDYMVYLRGLPVQNYRGKRQSQQPINSRAFYHNMMYLEQFLRLLQWSGNPLAPVRPVSQLIWKDDRGKVDWLSSPQSIKFIPETVLRKLDEHIHELTPAHLVPIVILLRASGWRISDVLNLRHDTCLEKTSAGWWLVGDITKTQVKAHRVPISEEIAQVVAAQRTKIRAEYSDEINPSRYLFTSHQKHRQGQPLLYQTVRSALCRFADKFNITDDEGNIYHFRCHAFRHTKAVELINNGMSLINVQKWMAHQSPEMTLIYAKVLDTTMREQWEQAYTKGAVKIDAQGQPQPDDGKDVAEWDSLRTNPNSFRLRDGYCFLPKKMTCPAQLVPCYTCSNFRTSPEFLPQFQEQKRDIEERIQVGEEAGNTQWVERNRQQLQPLIRIVDILESGKGAQGSADVKEAADGGEEVVRS